jgi:hypothetical protein
MAASLQEHCHEFGGAGIVDHVLTCHEGNYKVIEWNLELRIFCFTWAR